MVSLMNSLVPVSMFAMVVIIVYLSHRRKERMEMIKKGMAMDDLYKRHHYFDATALKWGLMAIGIGIGVLMGKVLIVNHIFEKGSMPAYFSIICLFGGIGLIISYFIEKKKEDKS